MVAEEGKVRFGGRGVDERVEMEDRAEGRKGRVEREIESRVAVVRMWVMRGEGGFGGVVWVDIVGVVMIASAMRWWSCILLDLMIDIFGAWDGLTHLFMQANDVIEVFKVSNVVDLI